MTVFEPGEYVVNKNHGERGYVVEHVDGTASYTVRLTHGYATWPEDETVLDTLMLLEQ